VQHERVVNRDTMEIAHRVPQIEKTPWRNALAGCSVIVYEHLDGTLSVGCTWWVVSMPKEGHGYNSLGAKSGHLHVLTRQVSAAIDRMNSLMLYASPSIGVLRSGKFLDLEHPLRSVACLQQ
jgi:hypothetical protein